MAMKKGAKIGLGIFAGITAFVVIAVAALFVVLYGGRDFKGGEFTAEEKEAVVQKLPVLETIEQQRTEGTLRGKKLVFSAPKKEQVNLSQGEINALLAVRDFKAEDLANIFEDVLSNISLEAERSSEVAFRPVSRGNSVALSGALAQKKDEFSDSISSGEEKTFYVTIGDDGNLYDKDGNIIGTTTKGEDGITYIETEDGQKVAIGDGAFIKLEGDKILTETGNDNNGYLGDVTSESNGSGYQPQGDTRFLKYDNGSIYLGDALVASLDGDKITLTDGRVLGTVDKNNDIVDENKAIIGEIDGNTIVLYGDDVTGRVGSLVKLEGISAGISGDILTVSIGIARCKTGQTTIDDYLSGSVVALEFKTVNGRVYLANVKINGLGADLIPDAVLNSLPDYNGGGVIQYLNDNLGEAITATFEHIFIAEEIYSIEIKDGQIYMDGVFYQEVSYE